MTNKHLHSKMAFLPVLFALLLSVAGVTKAMAQSFSVGNLNYSINNDGVSVTVTGHVNGQSAMGELVIPENVEYEGFTYSVTVIGQNAFYTCKRLTGELTIPNTVTIIGNNAFYGCRGFSGTLTLGQSLTQIGNNAFSSSCGGFNIFNVLAEVPPTVGTNAFSSVNNGILVYVPCGTLEAYQNANGWNSFTNIQETPCTWEITATTLPAEGGTVSGAGTYEQGQTCTLVATPNEGYSFANWTENDQVVSVEASYSFTVTEDRDLVANFTSLIYSYTITATANPAEGGTVSGADTYEQGQTCTLVASANEGYSFAYWTEGGQVVSVEASYSFTVTEDRNFVANFTSLTTYTIAATANPTEGGIIDIMTVSYDFEDGTLQGWTPIDVDGDGWNWYTFLTTSAAGPAHSGEYVASSWSWSYGPTDPDNYLISPELSNPASINYFVATNVEYPDHYGVYASTTSNSITDFDLLFEEVIPVGKGGVGGKVSMNGDGNRGMSPWSERTIALPSGTRYVAFRHFDSYDMNYIFIDDVTISSGVHVFESGQTCTMTAIPNEGYVFENWTENGNVISTDAELSFTVTSDRDLVANFGNVHTQALNYGWNWWSTYIELNDNDGLSQLENSIGDAGIIIKSRDSGYVEAYDYNGETIWYGTLDSINNEQMYKIHTNAACNAMIVGDLTSPDNHPITINSGWNWMGFPCNQNVSVDVAMSNFTPENEDVIMGRNGFTTYYSEGDYNLWYGTLNTLEMGKGYMYLSNSAEQKTLVFQTGRGEAATKNVTTENNFFQPNSDDFANNMTMFAVVELDGEELRSEDYELVAFVDDECRGSVRLMYVEPINRYVAFLTVFGEPSETLYFRLTDGTQTELSMDELDFEADGMIGALSEPVTLHFGMTKLDENELSKVLVYPNPSNGMFNIQGHGVRKIEVFNAFGQTVVSKEVNNDHLQIDLSRYADGCYMLRVVTDNGITNSQLIKK